MPKVELPFEAILEATAQLDTAQLETLSQRLSEVRRLQKKQTFHTEAEQIKQRYEALSLSPQQWEQYHALLSKRREAHLSEEETHQWHFLATRNEELGVARVELLSDFARRHNLSLTEATRRLKIKPSEAVVV